MLILLDYSKRTFPEELFTQVAQKGSRVSKTTDMIKIYGTPVNYITKFCSGIVDICGDIPYIRCDLEMGGYIVVAPVLIYINNNQKEHFSKWLVTSCSDRFLAVSANPRRFLTSGPRKVHLKDVLHALAWSNICQVNAHAFGMKSNYDCFLWFDDITENPATSITTDVGYYMEHGGICLTKPKRDVTFPEGGVSKFPHTRGLPWRIPSVRCITEFGGH